jgi:dihydrofolate synthase/folylpolyglutamate synthase
VEFGTLADAERYLDGFINRERLASFDYEKLGLDRIRALLAELGHPEAGLPCVHITGSNGKGTAALATESLLRAAGRRVGTYTSPHLESWRERYRIDGETISEERLVEGVRRIAPATEKLRRGDLRPSFFDVTTALGLALFREESVDAAVVEVGIGGRIDSTNVVESRVSVLTSVQLEHTDKLGSTLEAIAREKAGILRPGAPFLYGPLAPEAEAAVLAVAVADDGEAERVPSAVRALTRRGLEIELGDGRRVSAPVLGRHQAANVALAVRASELFEGRNLDADELGRLESLRVPARIEPFQGAILDCAHTPDAARALRETIRELWPDRPWVAVISLARDKDAAGVLSELADPIRSCVLTRSEPIRSFDPEHLAALAWAAGIESVESVPDPKRALAAARELMEPDDLLVVAGSIYLAGELRPLLRAAGEAGSG